MADIVDLHTGISSKSPTMNQTLPVKVLREILKDANDIKDLLVFTKHQDDNISLFHTGLDIKDLSLIVQLLQHDIWNQLAPTEDVDFEPNL